MNIRSHVVKAIVYSDPIVSRVAVNKSIDV